MADRKSTRVKRRRDYKAEYTRRIARGSAKGLTRSQARGHPKPSESSVSPRRQPAPLPDQVVQQALQALRRDQGLRTTAKALHVSPERLKHALAGRSAIVKKGRKWVIRPDLPRRMSLYSQGRELIVTVADFESASRVGQFMDAVGRFLRSNDRSLLAPFVGQSVTDVAGKSHPFETDPNVLYRITSTGGDTFEQIYRIII